MVIYLVFFRDDFKLAVSYQIKYFLLTFWGFMFVHTSPRRGMSREKLNEYRCIWCEPIWSDVLDACGAWSLLFLVPWPASSLMCRGYQEQDPSMPHTSSKQAPPPCLYCLPVIPSNYEFISRLILIRWRCHAHQLTTRALTHEPLGDVWDLSHSSVLAWWRGAPLNTELRPPVCIWLLISCWGRLAVCEPQDLTGNPCLCDSLEACVWGLLRVAGPEARSGRYACPPIWRWPLP